MGPGSGGTTCCRTYRVLDLTDERGHFAGYLLAALGADVIAVEPPGGMGARRLSPFVGDRPGPGALAHPPRLQPGQALGRARPRPRPATGSASSSWWRGRTSWSIRPPPGELERLGLGDAALAAANPALVHASISAFGQDGPKASWPATDLTVLASSGSLVLNGDRDRPPVRMVVPQAFLMARPSPPAAR